MRPSPSLEFVGQQAFAIWLQKLDVRTPGTQDNAPRRQRTLAIAADFDGAKQRNPLLFGGHRVRHGDEYAIDFRQHDIPRSVASRMLGQRSALVSLRI